MAHKDLDLRERRRIEDLLNARLPVSRIAAEIGRHRSTVYRDLKRNHFDGGDLPELAGYYALNAQPMSEKRRALHHKMIQHPQLKAAVEHGLKAGWSPEQIGNRLIHEGATLRVCQETIYPTSTRRKAWRRSSGGTCPSTAGNSATGRAT